MRPSNHHIPSMPLIQAHPRRLLHRDPDATIAWARTDVPVGYVEAVEFMEARAAAIRRGDASELVWLVEHPALYTAGSSSRRADLLTPDRFPVHETRRGGQFTYHGPGQRVAYLMLDVGMRGRDVRSFVGAIEDCIIGALARLGVDGETREGRVGVWVRRPAAPNHPEAREDKIAAIGVRLKSWVSLHGLSINVAPDLDHFAGIVPCGIAGHGVTSLADLGRTASMEAVDLALRAAFDDVFGTLVDAPCPLQCTKSDALAVTPASGRN